MVKITGRTFLILASILFYMTISGCTRNVPKPTQISVVSESSRINGFPVSVAPTARTPYSMIWDFQNGNNGSYKLAKVASQDLEQIVKGRYIDVYSVKINNRSEAQSNGDNFLWSVEKVNTSFSYTGWMAWHTGTLTASPIIALRDPHGSLILEFMSTASSTSKLGSRLSGKSRHHERAFKATNLAMSKVAKDISSSAELQFVEVNSEFFMATGYRQVQMLDRLRFSKELGVFLLAYASNQGNFEFVRKMVDAGIDPNSPFGPRGITPLQRAKNARSKDLWLYLESMIRGVKLGERALDKTLNEDIERIESYTTGDTTIDRFFDDGWNFSAAWLGRLGIVTIVTDRGNVSIKLGVTEMNDWDTAETAATHFDFAMDLWRKGSGINASQSIRKSRQDPVDVSRVVCELNFENSVLSSKKCREQGV